VINLTPKYYQLAQYKRPLIRWQHDARKASPSHRLSFQAAQQVG